MFESKDYAAGDTKTTEQTAKTFTNEQKVFACRVFLLAPVVCILSVGLVLLIAMEMMPGHSQSETDSENPNCRSLNCTVQYRNDSNNTINTMCMKPKDKVGNFTRKIHFDCVRFEVWCGLGISNGSRNSSGGNVEISWEGFAFCLRNLTKFGFLEDNLVENASYFIEKLFTKSKNGTSIMSCQFDKVKPLDAPACRGDNMNDDNASETDKEKHMKENTRVADIVLAVLLPLGLVVLILMCVYTRRTLKLCCNLCYNESEASSV